MTTTIEKFDFISGAVDDNFHAMEILGADSCDYPYGVQCNEILCSIQQDYADKLEKECYLAEKELEYQQVKLANIIREEKENKRVAKLRLRKTSKGMSAEEFREWADGRIVDIGHSRIIHTTRCSDDSVYGHEAGSRKIHTIDLSKTWRVVE